MSKAKKIVTTIMATLLILLTLFNTVAVLYTFFTVKSFFESDFYSFFPGMEPPDIYLKIDDVGYIRYGMCYPDPDNVVGNEPIETYPGDEIRSAILAARAATRSSDNTEE